MVEALTPFVPDAKSIFYDWWRKPKPDKPPIIDDLFAQNHLLMPKLEWREMKPLKKWREVRG